MSAGTPPQPPPLRGLAGRGTSVEEGLRGLTCGILFGIASPLSAHPLDTIKTMAQTTHQFGSSASVALAAWRDGGVRRLYRGLLPPLLGSSLYRSIQFSAYGAAFGALRNEAWATGTEGWLAGVPPRVYIAALVSTTARVLVETPLEVLKIRRQTGQSWGGDEVGAASVAAGAPARRSRWRAVAATYRGLGITWWRTLVALGGYFVLIDAWGRHVPPTATTGSGTLDAFMKGAVCATTAWVAAWPLELLKSSVQSGLALDGVPPSAGLRQRAAAIWKQRGLRGLYRGIGPGVLRSVVGNGCATAAYTACAAALDVG